MGIPIYEGSSDSTASSLIHPLGREASSFPCLQSLTPSLLQQLVNVAKCISPTLFRVILQQDTGRQIIQLIPDEAVVGGLIRQIQRFLRRAGICPRMPDRDTLIELAAAHNTSGDFLIVRVRISDQVVGQEVASNLPARVYRFVILHEQQLIPRAIQLDLEDHSIPNLVREVPARLQESDNIQSVVLRARYRRHLHILQAQLIWRYQPRLETDANWQPNQQISVEQQNIRRSRVHRLLLIESFLRQMENDTNPAHEHLIGIVRSRIEAQAQPQLYEHLIITSLMIVRGFLTRGTNSLSMEEDHIETPDQQRNILYTEIANHLGQEEPVLLNRIMAQIHGLRSILLDQRRYNFRIVLGEALTERTERLIQEVEAMVFAQQAGSQSQITQTAGEEVASEPTETNVTSRTRQQERGGRLHVPIVTEQESTSLVQQEQAYNNDQRRIPRSRERPYVIPNTIRPFHELSTALDDHPNLLGIDNNSDTASEPIQSQVSTSDYRSRPGLEEVRPLAPNLPGLFELERERRNRERRIRERERMEGLQNPVTGGPALGADGNSGTTSLPGQSRISASDRRRQGPEDIHPFQLNPPDFSELDRINQSR
ncbi:hypothetical protein DSL72_001349 [Monilinia vaccinii-corymbosi]|uniref:Uncharacterized protein n=1 Tax=Monilinia vaccinii-corymbosi TaxID=61207 RepID=A0A8A3P4P4_9HELO|nr:hypothetical protein DSL72_001349 [Monilinia vaccinii-corymbosi]